MSDYHGYQDIILSSGCCVVLMGKNDLREWTTHVSMELSLIH